MKQIRNQNSTGLRFDARIFLKKNKKKLFFLTYKNFYSIYLIQTKKQGLELCKIEKTRGILKRVSLFR